MKKLQDTYSTGNGKKDVGKNSPARMLVITICGIVIAEAIAMVVLLPIRHWPYVLQVLIDATVMAIIIFPLLFFFTLKPLLQSIQQKNRADMISKARLRLIRYVYSHTLDELLQASLDEIEALTGSSIGFFHFLEADQRTLSLQAWSTNTLEKMCTAEGKGSHYDVDRAGVWADCIRLRQVIIHNDYVTLPNRKGLPEGHAQVIREITVPIIRNEKILAILGVGNKPALYTPRDVEDISTIADFVWDIVEKKKAEIALRENEEKFHTLMDWTYDWEKWLDPKGNTIYMSPSCKRITGYSPEEFIENPELLKQIIHPDDQRMYLEHHRILHDQHVGPSTTEYRIIDREGNEHWIEHVCRPLFGESNRYLGRRVSNRDITERKNVEEEIRRKNQKEAILTQVIQNIQNDIARDLHDTLGQNISYMRMNLEYLADTMTREKPEQISRIQSLTRAANESYELIRSMLTQLKSGDSTDPDSVVYTLCRTSGGEKLLPG